MNSGNSVTIKKDLWKEIKRARHLYLMALPILVFYIVFHYVPMYGASMAFKNFKPRLGILGSEWVGFKYFLKFFSDPYCARIITNTAGIGFYQIVFGTPVTIIFALLLNEISNNRFKKLIQTVSYLPHFVSLVVICGIIQDFFSRNGIITQVLGTFGLPEKNLLTVPEYFKPIYVSTGIWQSFGWGSIVYLSALSGIDMEQYEAASIDGAGRLKKAIHITLPGIFPTISIMLILNMGSIMSVGFEKIILLYNSATYKTADVISSYVYRMGLAGDYPQYSYAAAIGLFSSVINLLFVCTGNKICKKLNGSALW